MTGIYTAFFILPILFSILGFVVLWLVLYTAIRYGVSAGLNASKLDAACKASTAQPTAPAGFKWVLVKDEESEVSQRVQREMDNLRI